MRVQRIAIVVSHPIQHFCPQYASFAKNPRVEIKVFFASALGFKKYVDPSFGQEIAWDNLQLDRFPHVFLNGDQVLPANRQLDAPSLDAALTAFAPAIVITYGYFQKLQRRAYAWARRNRVPLAYISDSERRQHRSWWKELIKYPFIKRYFSGIDYFLSVGEANEAFYKYYGVPEKKLVRMHFPIDIEQYAEASENYFLLRDKIRRQYGFAESDIVLAVVGKLVPWKNQGDIIDAMGLLESRGIQTHLLILGSGTMMNELQKRALNLQRSKVHFCGFVHPSQLPGFYAATDIYVHPASAEPHSIAISEAIFMGCPVILSDRCGSYGKDDDVQEHLNGLVYPFGNIEALAQKLYEIITQPLQLKSFASYSKTIGRKFQLRAHREVLTELLLRIKD
ncbi:MAG TPA: glycosyltransferase family 4 protein [Chitinophagaceae bacterium]|jgi:glycosyltransferase involved in cell wall biosynthesis|nr:glycosyltransferase family 4 protein [Chitinophagaceae bacterium]